MIFENDFEQTFYTLLQISGFFPKPSRKPKRCPIHEKTFKNSSQSEKFVDKNYRHFENLLLLFFETFCRLFTSALDIHQPISLSAKSIGQFRFFQTNYE